MTILESVAPAPLARRAEAPATRAAAARLWRWIRLKGWIHVLLLSTMAGCIYPLAWMALTSIKTDEELGQDRAVPAMPVFRDHSPYIRDAPEIGAPDELTAAQWRRLSARLKEIAVSKALEAMPSTIPSFVDPNQWAASAASALMARTMSQVPQRMWSSDPNLVTEHCSGLWTPETVGEVLLDQLARLQLTALQLSTLDGRSFNLDGGGMSGVSAAHWQTSSPNASLTASGDGVDVGYHFSGGSDAPIVLTRDFDLPAGVEATDIHKVALTVRSDGSWHSVNASIDVGGTHWTATRATYLAQNRAQSISFQPPTFDDTTIRARTWVPLRAAGPSDRAHNARMTLQLSPSSALWAVGAKVQRNYLRAFDSVPFFRYVGNSLLLVALTLGGALFSSAFVAYAFARLAWPGRSVALVMLLATMMVPPQVTMIPSFLIWRQLGWYNTLNPLWVPAWFGNGFFIFLMIQHMKTIPKELEEAARIDGLGIVQTWWYIIVPQLKPSLAAIAVLSFLGSWNEFMGPLIYLRDQSKFPLSLGLFGMRIDHGADWSVLMAANVLMTVPSLLVFFRFQRHFIEGMTVSGMKG